MSPGPFILAGIIWAVAGVTSAAESAWRTVPLPPKAAQLNQEAEVAADPAAAVALYVQALRACPSNGPALYGLGRALLAQGRAADSLKVLRRMEMLYPDDSAIQEALAAASARLPDPSRADIAAGLAFAERAAQLAPGSAMAFHLLSVLRHLNGDYAAAAAAARQAVALDARNPVDLETTAIYQQQETACTDALSVFSPLD